MTRFHWEKGVTLIELLITIVIAGLMMSSIFDLYLNAKQQANTNNAQQALSQQQLLLNQLLQQQISGAGYLGCAYWGKVAVYDDRQQRMIATAISINTATDPNLPDSIKQRIQAGTPALTVRQMNMNITDVMAINGNNSLLINENIGLASGDAVIIASCTSAEINSISSIVKQQDHLVLNLNYPLKQNFSALMMIGKYSEKIFYVGDTGRKTNAGAPIFALYLSDTGAASEEITDALSGLSILVAAITKAQPVFMAKTGDLALTQYNLMKLQLILTLPTTVNGTVIDTKFETIVGLREACAP